jgi:membrane-associated phospholipid phosphatase
MGDDVTADTRLRPHLASMRPQRSPTGGRRRRWWLEIIIAVVFYELYSGVQSWTTGHVGAHSHALEITRLEQHLHIWVEPWLNRFATAHSWLALGSGYYYELTHVCVTAGTLVFLWWRRAEFYSGLRNVLVAISLPALLVYGLWPVAPPRLANTGFTDTLIVNNILGAADVSDGFVNLYAAMPSLHVAWAVWCAGAIALTTKSRWGHLAWIYPAMTTFAVLATANHYVLDAVAGAALTALVFLGWRPYRDRARRSLDSL